MFLIRSFITSVRAALSGLLYVLRTERNFRIEVYCGITALVLAHVLVLSGIERVIIYATISLVLMMELINTATERIVDILKPRIHPYARVIKDIMAGAVLITSIAALAVGTTLFYPYMKALF